ncbi:hypothetical protein [Caballeronia catudaia]|nr:hypothetical protein [Caballeronia catudaia]
MSNAKRLTMQGGTTLDGFALLILFQVSLKVDRNHAHFLHTGFDPVAGTAKLVAPVASVGYDPTQLRLSAEAA